MPEDQRQDEHSETQIPIPSGGQLGNQQATNIGQRHQEPVKPFCWMSLSAWNVLFNGVLAVTTLSLALIAYWQFEATNTANRTSMEALRISQESYKLTKRSEEPYLTVEEVATQGTFPSDIKLLLKIHNHGRGVAIRIVGNATIGIRPGRLESPPRFDPGGNFTIAAIPPVNGRINWIIPQKPLDRMVIKDIQLGTRKFYVFGFLEYKDIDDEVIPPTPFCFLYNPNPERPSNISPFDLCSF